jgi:hypothetical protein
MVVQNSPYLFANHLLAIGSSALIISFLEMLKFVKQLFASKKKKL